MKKKILLFMLLVLILFVVFYIIYKNTIGSSVFGIYMNWDIKLPKPDEIIYEKRTATSFGGDGVKYKVFKYSSNSKIDKLNNIKWNNNGNQNFEENIITILEKLDIEAENIINFSMEYLFFYKESEMDKLYIIYFPQVNLLYIVEDIY